jgi:2-keto-3-deoxy-L-rhamnonate aldolase RhmA
MEKLFAVLERPVGSIAVMVWAVTSLSCAPASQEAEQAADNPNHIIQLLSGGEPVFGIFSGEHSATQGTVMARNRETDFVFYSLESGPFDIPTLRAYMQGMRDTTETDPVHPLALRIPPIRDGVEAAREHVREALGAGVDAIVFPHVETARDAAVAVTAMGPELWPGNAEGRLLSMLIVEDRAGVESVREIVSTPGVGVVFAGPGDLRRAYDRDMEAVENAIQTVLAACKAADVPCGITAGVDDIAERLAQGFRVIIVTEPEALAAGREAAGRL